MEGGAGAGDAAGTGTSPAPRAAGVELGCSGLPRWLTVALEMEHQAPGCHISLFFPCRRENLEGQQGGSAFCSGAKPRLKPGGKCQVCSNPAHQMAEPDPAQFLGVLGANQAPRLAPPEPRPVSPAGACLQHRPRALPGFQRACVGGSRLSGLAAALSAGELLGRQPGLPKLGLEIKLSPPIYFPPLEGHGGRFC